jgi:hypothetical protein
LKLNPVKQDCHQNTKLKPGYQKDTYPLPVILKIAEGCIKISSHILL